MTRANLEPAVRWDNVGLMRVLKAVAVSFLVLCPVFALGLTDLPMAARLWAGFLTANVIVWAGVVAVLAVRAGRRRAKALRQDLRRTRESAAGRLAVE